MLENIRKCQKMLENARKIFENDRKRKKMIENDRKCQKNARKMGGGGHIIAWEGNERDIHNKLIPKGDQ